MVTASRVQNMVQIRRGKNIFRDEKVFSIVFVIFTFRVLGVESPRGGAILNIIYVMFIKELYIRRAVKISGNR